MCLPIRCAVRESSFFKLHRHPETVTSPGERVTMVIITAKHSFADATYTLLGGICLFVQLGLGYKMKG
jgi:hypothetical protein